MKKTISFILCLSLAAATVMPAYALEQDTAETNPPATDAPETDSTKITKGDITADGIVDVTDLTELSLALIGDRELSDEQMKAADVDDTGEVNLADLAKIRQFLSKKIPSLENIPENDPSKMPYDFFITSGSSSEYRELKEALELDSEEFSKYLIKTNNGIRTKKQAEEFISAVDKVSLLGNIKGNIYAIIYDKGISAVTQKEYEKINISIKTDDEKRVSYEFLPFSEPSELYQGWADKRPNSSIYETPLQNNAGNFRVYAVSEPERSTDPYIIIAGINDITVRIMYYTDNADDINIQSWLDWTSLVSVEDYDKPNEDQPAESVPPRYYYDLHFNDYENLSDNLLASMYEKADENKANGAHSEEFEKFLELLKGNGSVWVPAIDGEEPEWRNKSGFYNISMVEDLFGKPCLFFNFADEDSNSYIKVTDVSEEFKKLGTKSTVRFLKAMDKTPDDDFFAYDQSETKIIELTDGTSVEAIFGKITKTETSWDGSIISDTRTRVHFLYNGLFVSVCCRPETLEAGLLEKLSLKSIPLNNYKFDSTPVFLIRNKEKVNTQFGERELYFNHVFTADGNSYNSDVPQYKPGVTMPTYEEEISTFINLGKNDRKLTLKNKTLLKKATELAKNAALYKDCELIKIDPKPYDECETSLKLIYRDENGELKPLTVYYNNGGSASWIDNAEIQEFIILMIEQGYLEGTNFLKAVTTVPDKTPVETDHPDPPLVFDVKSISEYNGLKQAMEQSDEELKQYIASMEGHFSLNDRESAEKFTEQIDKLSFPKIISGKVSDIDLTTGKSLSGETYEYWHVSVNSENGEWVRYNYYPDTAPDSFDYDKIGEAKNATVAIWGTPLQNNDGSIKIYADYMIPHSSGTGYLVTMFTAINGETFTVSYYTHDPDKDYLTILKSASLVNIDGLDE